MTVRVITDSAAALPAELVAAEAIDVVPLWMHIGEDSFRDGEMPLADLMARGDEPFSTAAPSPGEFAEVMVTAADDGPVVVLTVASTMSSTHDSAMLAARKVGPEVTVVDTQTAAGAQGLVVLAAARAANSGADVREVLYVAQRAMEAVRLVATVPDLTRLAQSGRLPETARRIGARVGAQPLFELRRGRIRPMRPAFSRRAALDRIVDRCADDDRPGALHVAVLHALDPAAAGGLQERVVQLAPTSCFVGPFSPVMVAHTGPGLAGLAWWSGP
jgi:DegV family protein with EDD domain